MSRKQKVRKPSVFEGFLGLYVNIGSNGMFQDFSSPFERFTVFHGCKISVFAHFCIFSDRWDAT